MAAGAHADPGSVRGVGTEGLKGSDGAERSAADSRRRLVDAAVELVFEHYAADLEIRDVYDYLSPGAVAQRAGVSRGLIYHHWGGGGIDDGRAVDRFLEEVAASICGRTAGSGDIVDAADLLPDHLSDVLIAFSDYEMDRMAGEGRAALQATQALTLHDMWPGAEADIVRAKSIALYERLAEKLAREPVPPLEIADIANAMSAVVEGFALMSRLYPDDFARRYSWQGHDGPPAAVDDAWNLLAVVAESVVINMTRPIGSDDAPTD